MSWEYKEPNCSFQTSTSAIYSYFDLVQKPVEIFVFIDPLCPESWSLEPILKKLSVEYGRFFTIQPILSGSLDKLNKGQIKKPNELKEAWDRTAKLTGMSCDGDLWLENPISTPSVASLAIKAAELQGKRAGRVFLRRVQENVFLKKQNISDESVLRNCAEQANLDVEEFNNDLYSISARKALQCDLKLTKEMDVNTVPTLVFFNQVIDKEGIKITGLHDYETYVDVLKEILQKQLFPSEKPSLEQLLKFYKVVGTTEVSVVYDWSLSKAEKELKKLLLKRKVRKIEVKYGNFWQYRSKD